jgi:hypothetical protein
MATLEGVFAVIGGASVGLTAVVFAWVGWTAYRDRW